MARALRWRGKAAAGFLQNPEHPPSHVLKRLFDILGGAVLLFVLAPVMVVIAGALTEAVPVAPGDTVVAHFDRLGTVELACRD